MNFCEYLNAVNDWLLFNDLLLNPDKSQCLRVGTRQQLKACTDSSVDVCGTLVPCSDSLKLLGVTLDSMLNFDKHVSLICSSAFFQIRALRHIRKQIDEKTAKTIATTFIASKLDYCNAILSGASKHNIKRLQHVQNATARVVLNTTRGSSEHLCKSLHWLPISQRIDYKIALLTFKVAKTACPSYLFDHLNISKPSRSLRSSNKGLLFDIPFCKTETASRAFSIYAPKLWNSLPRHIRDTLNKELSTEPVCTEIEIVKRSLKTFFI